MYFIDKKLNVDEWATIYYCVALWPIELIYKHLDKSKYRIRRQP